MAFTSQPESATPSLEFLLDEVVVIGFSVLDDAHEPANGPVARVVHSSNGLMQSVKKSVLVPYSAAEMFELVDRIELYPQFLPWCGGTRALEARADGKTARIDINYHGVRAHFTTDNVNRAGESIVITLRDGPFRHLHGEWRFVPLAARRLQGRARARLRVRDAPAREGRGPGVRSHREYVHRRVRPAGRGRLSEALVNVTVVWATPHLQDVVAVELTPGATIADAVRRSGLIAQYGLDPATLRFARYGVRRRGRRLPCRRRSRRNHARAPGRSQGRAGPARAR